MANKKANKVTKGGYNKQVSLPLWQVLAVVLLIGVLGGIFLVRSFADPASKSSATLIVSPNPLTYVATSTNQITLTGCGYPANHDIVFGSWGPAAIASFGGTSDANGCLDVPYSGVITGPGTYKLNASIYSTTGKTRAIQLASTVLTVK